MYLDAPWYSYESKLHCIFYGDSEVFVGNMQKVNDGEYTIDISSRNSEKLNAIEQLFGKGQEFGNISVKINYKYENSNKKNYKELWETAFNGNPIFLEFVERESPMGDEYFAVFTRDIMTFYNDNLGDYCKNSHFVVADVIRDIANCEAVHPCTARGIRKTFKLSC